MASEDEVKVEVEVSRREFAVVVAWHFQEIDDCNDQFGLKECDADQAAARTFEHEDRLKAIWGLLDDQQREWVESRRARVGRERARDLLARVAGEFRHKPRHRDIELMRDCLNLIEERYLVEEPDPTLDEGGPTQAVALTEDEVAALALHYYEDYDAQVTANHWREDVDVGKPELRRANALAEHLSEPLLKWAKEARAERWQQMQIDDLTWWLAEHADETQADRIYGVYLRQRYEIVDEARDGDHDERIYLANTQPQPQTMEELRAALERDLGDPAMVDAVIVNQEESLLNYFDYKRCSAMAYYAAQSQGLDRDVISIAIADTVEMMKNLWPAKLVRQCIDTYLARAPRVPTRQGLVWQPSDGEGFRAMNLVDTDQPGEPVVGAVRPHPDGLWVWEGGDTAAVIEGYRAARDAAEAAARAKKEVQDGDR
jgi:hypothetical protein